MSSHDIPLSRRDTRISLSSSVHVEDFEVKLPGGTVGGTKDDGF